MYTGDAIYRALLKYDYFLLRNDETVYDFLSKHLKDYYSDISNAVNDENPLIGESGIEVIKQELPKLELICSEIPRIIKIYSEGHITESFKMAEAFFDTYSDYLICEYQWGPEGHFYRLRSGNYRILPGEDSKEKKKELFHIRKGMNNKIGAYRYSVPGYPCLYLADGIELPWYECNMPSKFSYCEFQYSDENGKALKLIDFSLRPVMFLADVESWIYMYKNEPEKLSNSFDALMRYVMSYPIAAACSIKVKERSSQFVEEYVFPQMLMEWVRESEMIDGVIYKSSLNSTMVTELGTNNIALVVKNYREDGLDEKLTKCLKVSDIGYLDITKQFQKVRGDSDRIIELRKALLQYMMKNEDLASYIYKYFCLCERINILYMSIIEMKYSNAELVFSSMDLIADYIDLLYARKADEIEKAKKEAGKRGADFEVDYANEMIDSFKKMTDELIFRNTAFHLDFEPLDNFEEI